MRKFYLLSGHLMHVDMSFKYFQKPFQNIVFKTLGNSGLQSILDDMKYDTKTS